MLIFFGKCSAGPIKRRRGTRTGPRGFSSEGAVPVKRAPVLNGLIGWLTKVQTTHRFDLPLWRNPMATRGKS